MRHAKLVVAVALAVVLTPVLCWAGGTSHNVFGYVRYNDGSIPQNNATPEVTFDCWIVGRESEVIDETYPGVVNEYLAGEWTIVVNTSWFPTPWSAGEMFHVLATGDGENNAAGVPETNWIEATLTNNPNDTWGTLYLPVELSSFTGEGGAGLAVLRWTTKTETDNLGFWLWRSTTTAGEYAKVNETLIKGAGTTTEPRDYSFTDDGLDAGTYFYKLEDVGATGVTQLHGPVEIEVMAPIPTEYGLSINTPNPVTDRTEIRFQLPEAAKVKLGVYNVAGSLVTTLVDGRLDAGYYRHEWTAAQVPSGIYFYRLEANNFSSTHRMVVLK